VFREQFKKRYAEPSGKLSGLFEGDARGEFILVLFEPVPVQWTPRSTKSVIHGQPVRSLATNREPAVGG